MKKMIFTFIFFVASFVVASAQTLQLPAGFTSTIVAEGLGGARHIAVTKQGGVYVNSPG